MTTLTSHSLPILPLQLNLASLNGGGLMGNTNTDTVLLHNHAMNGTTALPADSLRLSSPKEERLSPQSRYGSENSLRNSICDMDPRMDARKMAISLNIPDDISDARSSSVSSYQADSYHKEPDDDQMSYCSDESELSVGKEVESEQNFINRLGGGGANNRNKHVNGMDAESVDDSCTTPLTERINNLCGGSDEMSNESLRYGTKIPNIIRPSPTRLQEEFLRKSQMYAEELMKHQMNFMAATRGLNISPKINEHLFGYPIRSDPISPIRANDEPKIGFRPHIKTMDLEKKWNTIDDRSSQSPEGTNFRGIHSHLNAISRITSALGRDVAHLTSPGSITSRDSSQSPPNHFHQMLNNNINETNLKFSIDNILKPGFGRRITDPLLKRSNKQRKNVQRSVASEKHGKPMDLTAANLPMSSTITTTPTAIDESEKSPPPPLRPTSQTTPSATGAEQEKVTSTNSSSSKSSSGGPMVWPAWVYCTRYSDRPSSGKTFFFFFSLFLFIGKFIKPSLCFFCIFLCLLRSLGTVFD